jgi:hypothetical protein
MSGVGNFLYTVAHSAIRINLKQEKIAKTFNANVSNLVPHVLEVIVHSALHSVRLKSKVNVSAVSIVHVVLVQHIVQALVEVFKVEQDHCSSSLHTNLDLVDISTHLIIVWRIQ